jgi:hypothetical protein
MLIVDLLMVSVLMVLAGRRGRDVGFSYAPQMPRGKSSVSRAVELASC